MWSGLLALTLVVTTAMTLAHIPGALMLGPMISGLAIALYRPRLKMPGWSTILAQAVLGALIASILTPGIIALFLPHWLLILVMNTLLIVAIFFLGIIATRMGWFPGTAGIWGMSPGGASAMVMLSDAYGGDRRIVALMHYLRLVWAVVAVITMGFLLGSPRTESPGFALPGSTGTTWLAPIEFMPFSATIIIVVIGIMCAYLFRKGPLAIFAPMFLGILLQASGLLTLQMPPSMSAVAFGIVGWHVGLSFSRESLLANARYIPKILISIVVILLVCVALAAVLMLVAHVDFLTAYMALNPGGVDVVLLTAASVDVDLPIIIAMQISRLILAIAIAPLLGRLAASHHLRSEDDKL